MEAQKGKYPLLKAAAAATLCSDCLISCVMCLQPVTQLAVLYGNNYEQSDNAAACFENFNERQHTKRKWEDKATTRGHSGKLE
ncbi:hypothetical protein ACLKA7_003766 [Drosophila subpalustris]